MGDASYPGAKVKVHGDITAIAAKEWDACAGLDHPFVGYHFLSALEESGSATARTGWQPYHLTVENASGRLIGCAPMYVKGHSQGEYVFDHSWAHAFEQAGGSYYPKLLVAVPFTPATGPRFLVRPGEPHDAVVELLMEGAIEATRQLKLSSLHVNFLPEDDWRRLGQNGFLQRTGEQFHWFNRNYGIFDDFLNDLASRKRKNIRKERREALADGITIDVLAGAAITEAHWDAFFAFYMDTGSRKWGRPYLNRAFFSLVGERLGDRVILMMARRGRDYVAGSINFLGADTLYGRYWGCLEEHRFLHFEVCYYQAIELAIALKLARVEAGAQGPHKLARGYLPVHTYSAHWIRDAGFRRAVGSYLARERAAVDHEIKELDAFTPFRRGPSNAAEEQE
ncbi:MAG: N-acetyltransferase [Alphaproteobacteria bacterium]|nr:N-acetyltransferase [Alphaproteobacteria bacterium]